MGWKADIAQDDLNWQYLGMEMLSKRGELIRAAITAHLIGLIVVGFYGTIGTSGGFGNGA